MEQLYLYGFKGRSKGWLLGLSGFVLLVFNWRLVLSLIAGAGVMSLVYVGQQKRWRIPINTWRNRWNSVDQRSVVTIASGIITFLSAYLAIAIWLESDSPWLATGIILQGFATLLILMLIVWQGLNRNADKSEPDFDHILANLTDSDPLKRLIAVRQATQWVSQDNQSLPASRSTRQPAVIPTASHLADCFHLMLNQETEPIVRSALLDSLQLLSQHKRLAQGSEPLSMPAARRSAVKVHQVNKGRG